MPELPTLFIPHPSLHSYEEGVNLSEVNYLLQCARELGGLGMAEEEVGMLG